MKSFLRIKNGDVTMDPGLYELLKRRLQSYGPYTLPKILEEVGMVLDNYLAHYDIEADVDRYARQSGLGKKNPADHILYLLVPAPKNNHDDADARETLFHNAVFEVNAFHSDGAIDRTVFPLQLHGFDLGGKIIDIHGNINSYSLAFIYNEKIDLPNRLEKSEESETNQGSQYQGAFKDKYGNTVFVSTTTASLFGIVDLPLVVLTIKPPYPFLEGETTPQKFTRSLDLTGVGSSDLFRDYPALFYESSIPFLGKEKGVAIYGNLELPSASSKILIDKTAEAGTAVKRDYGLECEDIVRNVFLVKSEKENATSFGDTITIQEKIIPDILNGKAPNVFYHEIIHSMDSRYRLSQHHSVEDFFKNVSEHSPAFLRVLNEEKFGEGIWYGGHSQDNVKEFVASLANSLTLDEERFIQKMDEKILYGSIDWDKILHQGGTYGGVITNVPMETRDFFILYKEALAGYKQALIDKIGPKMPIIATIDRRIALIDAKFPAKPD